MTNLLRQCSSSRNRNSFQSFPVTLFLPKRGEKCYHTFHMSTWKLFCIFKVRLYWTYEHETDIASICFFSLKNPNLLFICAAAKIREQNRFRIHLFLKVKPPVKWTERYRRLFMSVILNKKSSTILPSLHRDSAWPSKNIISTAK